MRLSLLAAAGLLLLAGCGEESSSDPDAQSGPDLDGRAFIATSITDAGRTRHLAAGTELRLSFDDGRLGIDAGCNQMSGRYRVEAGRLVVRSMSTTDMGCEPRLMAQDAWVSGLFTDPVTLDLTGDLLRLHSGDVELELTDREVSSPDASLEGTTWVLDALISDDAVSSVPGGVVATLVIEAGEAHIDTGCNAIVIEVSIDDATITFGEASATTVDCRGDEARVEEAVRSVLQGTVTWSVTEQSLTIMGAAEGLGYRVA